MLADDRHPLAAATGGGAMTSDEGAPPHPAPPPPSSLPFFFYPAVCVFLLALLLPRLFPSRYQVIVCGVLNLDPAPDVFVVTSHLQDVSPTHRVLILPGLATGAFSFRRLYRSLAYRGLLAVVIDLPGQGFSPAPRAGGLASVIHRIMSPGSAQASSPYAPAQAAAAVARALEVLGLGAAGAGPPFHLVLHDSALAAGAAFAAANPRAVRSVTLIDANTASEPAFPATILDASVLGTLVLRVPPLFRWLVRRCCARGMGAEDAGAHRALMLAKGQARVVEAWKATNHSGFDLAEWRYSSYEVRKLPMMVLWSGTWSSRWISEGNKVAAALPDAKFIYHSGGRWPQEDAPDEISELITEFVTTFEGAAGDYYIADIHGSFKVFIMEISYAHKYGSLKESCSSLDKL